MADGLIFRAENVVRNDSTPKRVEVSRRKDSVPRFCDQVVVIERKLQASQMDIGCSSHYTVRTFVGSQRRSITPARRAVAAARCPFAIEALAVPYKPARST